MVRYLLSLIVAGVFVLLVGPLTSVGIFLSDSLASHEYVSVAIACGLIFLSVLKCPGALFGKDNSLTARRALLCYITFSFGMAGVYFLVNRTGHDCFQFPESQNYRGDILDFIYFSFITVTTVGYGDIVPKHSFVRGIVLLHVLFGLSLILKASQSHQKEPTSNASS